VQKIKVLVLEGGFNEEHEVSLETGNQVKKSLLNLDIPYDTIIVDPKNFEKKILNYSSKYVCFNALHGTFGEDGQIQKILDKLSIRYTHSSQETSFIGFNKKLTKEKIKNTDVLTPKYECLDYNKINKHTLYNFYENFGAFVIKPISSGSSFGIKIFKNKKDIKIYLQNLNQNLELYKDHRELLVEKFITGKELTVAVIDKDLKGMATDVTEIISNNNYFDYKSKYTPGLSKHILPAKIPINIYNKCKKYAEIVHDKIGCIGVSRSDFIFDKKEIFFLEINTQPGLTPISLVPEQLKYHNISFDELVQHIINCSL
tara:strand:- start:78 stop:1022 length:945 start_codon:yes stop_codon:yes gene_type:complete